MKASRKTDFRSIHPVLMHRSPRIEGGFPVVFCSNRLAKLILERSKHRLWRRMYLPVYGSRFTTRDWIIAGISAGYGVCMVVKAWRN